MQPIEKLSGGAGAKASAVGVGQDLLERALERDRVGDTRQRADGSGLGAASAVVVAEGVAADGGTATGLPVGAARSAAPGGVGEFQMGTGNPGNVGLGVGVWCGGIDPRDPRVQRTYRRGS